MPVVKQFVLNIVFDFILNMVCNLSRIYYFERLAMSNDAEIIKQLGGATKVAELLGYKKNGAQRVHNWVTRGIPARVKLDYPDLFQPKNHSHAA